MCFKVNKYLNLIWRETGDLNPTGRDLESLLRPARLPLKLDSSLLIDHIYYLIRPAFTTRVSNFKWRKIRDSNSLAELTALPFQGSAPLQLRRSSILFNTENLFVFDWRKIRDSNSFTLSDIGLANQRSTPSSADLPRCCHHYSHSLCY